MGGVGDFFSDPIGAITGGGDDNDAADAAIEASQIQADWQTQALEYLKQKEELPQQYREGALGQLAGAYGVEGGTGSQQDLINRAQASPLYSAIMGGQRAGEDAIMRNAAQTGGLRSGNVQRNLYDYNTQLQNTALLESYNQQLQGLGGLAQLPSLAQPIAQGMGNIGSTYAQGMVAAAQANQVGSQNQMGNMMGMANLGMQIWGMI